MKITSYGLKKANKTEISPFEKWAYKTLSALMGVCFFIILAIFILSVIIKGMVYPIKYKQQIFSAADSYGVDRALVLAVVKEESSFNPNAKSKAGAYGLMQLTNATADYVAQNMGLESYDILNAETNLNLGCYYLKYLLNKFSNLQTALAAYNAGEGKVSDWLKDKNFSQDGKTLKTVPYSETAGFVKKVSKSFKAYKKLYPNIVDKK